MKRVLIFSLAYFPHVGGAEVAVKEITDRISPSDIEFHMVTLNFGGEANEEKIGNIFVHRIGNSNSTLSKFLFQFSAACKASQLHRQYYFDGIWAMMAHSSGIPAGLFKTFHPDVKYLLTLQEGDPPEYIERLAWPVWPLFKRGFTKADELQAISNFLLAWGKRMGFKNEGILVPNGTDVERFSKPITTTERASLRNDWGIREHDIVLVSTSRLVHKNALDDVISALQYLPNNIRFINFGFGPDKEMLESLSCKLDVNNRVRLVDHPGLDILPKYLHACDFFIRPSRSEGFGISFIEAMAAGLPVIATQEGGIADFLFDAKRNPGKETTGWAVDKDSPEQIAEAVKDILANPEQAKKVVATARKYAHDNFDWDIIAKNMREKVFARVLG